MGMPGSDLLPLFDLLVECWTGALGKSNPDAIKVVWSVRWAEISDELRPAYAYVEHAEQKDFIARFRAFAGSWGDWVIVRLSQNAPFQSWEEWKTRSRELPHMAVGQTLGCGDLKGQTLPLRVFVLPRKALRRIVLPREDYKKLGDPMLWPHGPAPTKVIQHVRGILRWCLVRNLLSFTVEMPALILMVLIVVSLAGLAIWGSRSEAGLEYLLIAAGSFSACLFFLVIWEILREIVLVSREGWFHTWNDSLVRFVLDPQTPMEVKGKSYGIEVSLAAISGLAERVLGESPHFHHRSRYWTLMERFEATRGTYTSTGPLVGPFGLWIGRVGDIEAKWEAVDDANLAQFLVPVSRETIRTKLVQFLNPDGTRRARLRLRAFAPSAVMKLSGVFRRSALIGAVLVCGVFMPARDEWRLMARVYPPEPDRAARWSPRSGLRPDVNLLQFVFKGVLGNPADYFVIVEGSTRDPGPAVDRAEQSAPEVVVYGQSDLRVDKDYPGKVIAQVSLRATGRAPDPHRLTVVLFQRRSLVGLKLSSIPVSTFGLPDVEIDQ